MAVGITAADLRAGDVVRLKKAHPCGGYLWRVQRAGGDIGLRCETCGHQIMMPRFRIERRIRSVMRPDVRDTAAVAQSDGAPSNSGLSSGNPVAVALSDSDPSAIPPSNGNPSD